MATTAIHGHTNGRHTATGQSCALQNVGETERWASALGGGALTLYGLSRINSPAGMILAALGGCLLYRGVTGRCSMYSALGVTTAPEKAPATSVRAGQGVKIEKAIYINQPAGELYRHWRNLENLPRFMRHIKSITTEGGRSHWTARGPLGMSVEWDAEIINDQPNKLIAWRSLANADVDSAGSVHFQPSPGGRGTRVTVVLKYDPPAGKLGATLAQFLGQDPEAQIDEDLRRFKQLMETGELATSYTPGTERITWPNR